MPEPGKYAFPLTVSAVVDAYSNTEVEEAERAMGEPLNHICVVVEFASCPKLVVGVQAKELPARDDVAAHAGIPLETISTWPGDPTASFDKAFVSLAYNVSPFA